ncbi:TetR/AcrR family transcriptional regulator, partial [Candidatus Bipolaricaulota bacterium]|nr:TetR/AcrR family transcriptional regulator [Candidatus Bipolaricaulota bacterium]
SPATCCGVIGYSLRFEITLLAIQSMRSIIERTFVQWSRIQMKKSGKKDRREDIQEAAIEVIARKGYFQSTVKQIAEEAGVSAGTVYNYFEDKQDIIFKTFSSELEDRKKVYEAVFGKDISLFGQIRMVLDRHFSKAAKQEQLMKVIIQEKSKPGLRLGRKLNECYEEGILEVANLVEEYLEEDQIRECDPTVVASAMFGAVESVMWYGLLRDPETRVEIFDQAPDALANFFWKGMKKQTK